MRHRVRIIHGVLNYFLAAALVISPLMFPYDDSMAANLSLTVAGLASLCLALVSNYELGVIKSIRYKDNLLMNAILGSLLMLTPFIFGFSEFGISQHLAFGCLQIILPLGVYKLHSSKKRSGHLEFR